MGAPSKGLGAVGVTLVSAVLAAVLAPALAWVAHPQVIGQFNTAQLTIAVASLVLCLGLDQSYVRNFHDSGAPRSLLGACVRVPIWVGTVVLILGACYWGFGDELGLAYGEVVFILALASFLTMNLRFLTVVSRMSFDNWAFLATQVLPKFVLVAVCVSFGLADESVQLGHLLLALTGGTFFAVLLSLRAARRLKSGPCAPPFQELARFGLPLGGAALAYWGVQSFAPLMLARFAGWQEAGYYAVVVSFAAPATIFQVALGAIWGPLAYRWLAEGVAATHVPIVSRHITTLAAAAFLLMGSLGWVARLFLPGEYDELVRLIPAALLPSILYALSEVYGFGLGVARRSGTALAATIASLGAGTVLGAILIPTHGASGALCAAVAANFVLLWGRTISAARAWMQVAGYVELAVVTAIAALGIISAVVGDIWRDWVFVAMFLIMLMNLLIRPMAHFNAIRWLLAVVKSR